MERTNSGESSAARVLRVAWMAILLGLALEVVVATAANLQGAAWEPLRTVASAGQRVSWSVILCAVLAWAQTIQPPNAVRTGLFGFAGAPIAAIAARAVHKGVLQAGSATPAGGAGVPWGLIAVRALEYLLLGMLSTRLARKRTHAHLTMGLAVGALGLALQLTVLDASASSSGAVLLLALNELLFPAGCAVVLHAASAKARRDEAARASVR